MKRILSCAALLSVALFAQAQTAFFQYVPYQGAFAPEPAARWTDNWTEFDPQNATYPAATVSVTSNIVNNTTWYNDSVYLLDDAFIYVIGATLTIEPGTVIRGTGKGTLIIERGAKIHAQGTENEPIVFTSNNPAGQRDYGDWGGVVICGAAVHNLATGVNAEAEGGIGDDVAGRGLHGGSNDLDSSGVMTYCRIEFPGISLTPNPNSEINGLSMYSVGNKTLIHHIQVSYSGDDSFEWFGGLVDLHHIVAFRGWDDDFDTDNGFRGRIQFAASIRDSRIADQSGSNGFESDNDASGSNRYPKTWPVFSNVTIVGPNYTGNPDSTNSLYKRALHLRRNTKTSVFNSIFMGYPDAGLLLDGRKTTANVCGDSLEFEYNILAGMNSDWKLASGDTLCITSSGDMLTYFMAVNNDTLATSNETNLVDPFTLSDPDLRPTTSSIAVSGADFSNSKLGPLNTTGVDEVQVISGVTVYPNPADQFVNIVFESDVNGNAVVSILNLQGQVVTSALKNINQGSNTANLYTGALSNGVYLVQVTVGTSTTVQKLIIE